MAAAIFLAAFVVAVFAPSFRFEFVHWDDDINVYENPRIQKLDGANLAWMFTDLQHALRYKPLSWLTWTVTHAIFGLNPTAFHAINLLWHALNTVLVFFLLRNVLRRVAHGSHTPTSGHSVVPAAVGALLWAVHPLRVEPVAWVTGMPYCQSLFFLLLSLLTYLAAMERQPGRHRTVLYWTSFAAFGYAVLTYPIVLASVALLVVIDLFLFIRIQDSGWRAALSKRIWLEKIPFIALAAMLLLAAVIGRLQASGDWVRPLTLAEFPLAARVMQASYVWSYYLWKVWVPTDLAPVYTTLVSFHPAAWPFVLSLTFLLVATAFIAWRWRRWPLLAALWICHLALLVPVLGLTERPHYANDRYSYISSILWSVLFAFVLQKVWPSQRLRAIAMTVAIAATAWFSSAALLQIKIWRNSETLFRYTLAQLGEAPVSGPLHVRLGNLLLVRGRTDDALAQFMTAVRVNPADPEGQANIANALAIMERPAEAVSHYREAIRLKPDWPEMLNNLAWLLATHADESVRNGAEAVRLAQRAVELTRGEQPAFLGTLAAAYAESGRFAEAIATGEKARALALASGQRELVAANEKLLEQYRVGKPARATP